MLQNLLAFQNTITNKTNCKKGSMMPFLLIVFLGFMWLMFFKLDTNDRLITHQYIEDTISECLSSASADNLHNSYQPFRSSNIGAYKYNGVLFEEIKNTEMFVQRLTNDFNVISKNGVITSYTSDNLIDFQISNIELYVNNSVGKYVVKYDLSIPRKFGEYKLQTYHKVQVVKFQTLY